MLMLKTKIKEDAHFLWGALKLLNSDAYIHYGKCGVNQNGPTRGYWTIGAYCPAIDYDTVHTWFPNRPFIYSTTPKQTIWKHHPDVERELRRKALLRMSIVN